VTYHWLAAPHHMHSDNRTEQNRSPDRDTITDVPDTAHTRNLVNLFTVKVTVCHLLWCCSSRTMCRWYAIPEPEPMLATPESVDSSSASPESGVLAAEVFVLDPSLCNENSPARKIKRVSQWLNWKITRYKFLVKTSFHTSRFGI